MIITPPAIKSHPLQRLWVIGILAMIVVSLTMAQVTFAQFDETNANVQQWSVTTSAGISTTVSATGSVSFTFSDVPGSPLGPQTAAFSLNATSTQLGNCGKSCGAGDSYVQPGYVGMFSFTDTTTGLDYGDNLLSGWFSVTGSPSTTGAQFSSSVGGGSGGFTSSATAGNLNQLILTSDFVNFTGQDKEVASFSFSSLLPNFAVGTVAGNQAFPDSETFTAAGSGTFSSDATELAPEPASFALIGSGMLVIGMLRRKRPVRP